MPFRSNTSGFGGFGSHTTAPASVRYNNPGAQWPGPVATQYGSTGSHRIGGGNLIAEFPDAAHGAAAHIALLAKNYTGMTLTQLVRKWTGGTSDPSSYIGSISKSTGIKPNEIVTREMFSDPSKAITFAKAMAGNEAGTTSPVSDQQWQQGFDLAFPGTVGGPMVEMPTGMPRAIGQPLEINAGDTSRDRGSISTGGELSLGGNTSLGSELKTDFTGPDYAEQNYQPTGPDSSAFVSDNTYDASGTNVFDQWWKTSTDAPSVTVNAGDSGGSIWSGGDHTLSDFGNNVALGSDLSTSLDDLGLGTGYPAAESTLTPEPPLMADTGTGIEPAPLQQDYEWTTSPDDRRYLPGSEPSVDAPPTPTRTLAGTDLRNFGDPGRLSLGAYLNASLGSLRYGEGYPIEYGGRPPDLQAGEGYIAPETQTGGHWVDEPGGQRWVENSPGSTGFDDTPTGAAVSPDVRRGELINEGSSPSFGIIGQGGLPLHVTPTARTNPFNYGYGQSATSQENAALMSSTAFGGNPNVTRVSDEERIASSMNHSLRAEAGFGKPATAANRYRDFMGLYGRTGVHTKAELTAGATGRGG
jgi:hypothetical protein